MKARLDIALVSADWINRFSSAIVSHVATMTSDHSLLIIDFSPSFNNPARKTFKFEPMWVRSIEFRNSISSFWNSSTSAGTSITNILRRCAGKISCWNKSSFGGVQDQLNNLRTKLEEIQNNERTPATVEEESKIMIELDEWRFREELLWKQRSRIQWLMEGDLNTRYFHA